MAGWEERSALSMYRIALVRLLVYERIKLTLVSVAASTRERDRSNLALCSPSNSASADQPATPRVYSHAPPPAGPRTRCVGGTGCICSCPPQHSILWGPVGRRQSCRSSLMRLVRV